jgi:hypothetical protein
MMAQQGIKAFYYFVVIFGSFIIAAITFSGIIFNNDLTGRIIFGTVWATNGLVWLGQYIFNKKKKIN